LFPNNSTALEVIQSAIRSHWSHFEFDKEVIGLDKKIEEGRSKYPSNEDLNKIQLSDRQLKRIEAASEEIKSVLFQKDIKPAVSVIMMHTHIEEISGFVLGALQVDPFLRYLAHYLEYQVSQEINDGKDVLNDLKQ